MYFCVFAFFHPTLRWNYEDSPMLLHNSCSFSAFYTILHYVNISQLIHSFYYWWIFELFQFGASEKNEHSFVYPLVNIYAYISLVYSYKWKCLVIRCVYIQLWYVRFKQNFIVVFVMHPFRHLFFCGLSYYGDVFLSLLKKAINFLWCIFF